MRIAKIVLMGFWLSQMFPRPVFSQAQPKQTVQVAIVNNITTAYNYECGGVTDCLDNRSIYLRNSTYHAIAAVGPGTWQVQLQAANGSPTGFASCGTAATINQSSTINIGYCYGYFDYLLVSISGANASTVVVTYTGENQLLLSTVAGSVTFPCSVSQGCTGMTSLTLNGVLYGNGSSNVGVTAAGTQYQIFQAGASGVPVFGAVNLGQSAAITGTLPAANMSQVTLSASGNGGVGGTLAIANGGTGGTTASGARSNLSAAQSGANSDITSLSALTTPITVPQGGTGLATITANGIMYGAGASNVVVTAAGTQYQVFQAGASGVPVFGAVNLGQSAAITGTLPGANMTAVNLAASGNGGVTGTLQVANGGSGSASLGAHGALVAEGTSAFVSIATSSGGLCFMSNSGSADPSWQACPSSSGGANTTLSNLSASTSINAALYFQSAIDIGSTSTPPRNIYFTGAGTYGSASFEFTGTPTANRTFTLPDRTTNIATTTGTLTNSHCVQINSTGDFIDSGGACGGGGGSGTVSAATVNQITYYTGTGTTVGGSGDFTYNPSTHSFISGASGVVDFHSASAVLLTGSLVTGLLKITNTTGALSSLAISGTGSTIVSTSGTLATNDCVKISSTGDFIDSGSTCGGAGSSQWTTGTSSSIYYTLGQVSVGTNTSSSIAGAGDPLAVTGPIDLTSPSSIAIKFYGATFSGGAVWTEGEGGGQLQWRDSGGNLRMYLGEVSGSAFLSGPATTLQPTVATAAPLTLYAYTSGTADLLDMYNTAGTLVTSVSSTGLINTTGGIDSISATTTTALTAVNSNASGIAATFIGEGASSIYPTLLVSNLGGGPSILTGSVILANGGIQGYSGSTLEWGLVSSGSGAGNGFFNGELTVNGGCIGCTPYDRTVWTGSRGSGTVYYNSSTYPETERVSVQYTAGSICLAQVGPTSPPSATTLATLSSTSGTQVTEVVFVVQPTEYYAISVTIGSTCNVQTWIEDH